MTRRSHRFVSRFLALCTLLLVLAPALASAQVVVKLNDTVNFRLGMVLQSWADWTQDPNSEGYSQNFFIRRVRFILLATVAPRVTIFYQTDNPRVGSAGTNGVKNFNTGFLTQDAFLEWRFGGSAAALQGGLFLVPASRNALTSVATFTPVDLGTWQLQGNTVEQGNGGRDYGLGLNGYLLDDKLSYKAGIFDGFRRGTFNQTAPLGPVAGSRNSYRYAARVNYDFFDAEKGYTYNGTNNGAKKIVAVGGWGDTQGTYAAYGADFAVDWPIMKDAVKVEFDYGHFVGGPNLPTLHNQNDIYIDAGYYIDALKIQPFLKYETLKFSNKVDVPTNLKRVGGGVNWYISGQNMKMSVLFEKVMPNAQPASALIKNTNHWVVQIQAVYF